MLKKAVQQGPSNSLYLSLGEWPRGPLLRASNEHSFIVRVLRAKRAPGHPPLLADFFSILLTLIRLLSHLLSLNQAGQVRALDLEAVCCFCPIALRFFDGLLNDVAAMFLHRLMVRE